MRGLFLVTGVLSLLAASLVALLGVAYTWTEQATGTFQAQVAPFFATPPPQCDRMSFDNVIVGTEGDDRIDGGDGDDCVGGGDGDDELHGGDGNDVILGGPGNDRIHGGDGDETIDGGLGSDKCNGGSGANTISNCELPPGPTGLTGAFHHSLPTVALTWQPVADAPYYNVYRGTTSGGPYEGIGSSRATSYADTQVVEGLTYYYVVTSVDADGFQSGPSNEAQVVTYGATPTATPTPEPTATPAPEPTATPVPEPTATPEPTAAPEPTATLAPEPTAMPTSEPTPTPQPEPSPTPTPEPTSTPTLGPEPTQTPEA